MAENSEKHEKRLDSKWAMSENNGVQHGNVPKLG
jgi:hypothetical protein